MTSSDMFRGGEVRMPWLGAMVLDAPPDGQQIPPESSCACSVLLCFMIFPLRVPHFECEAGIPERLMAWPLLCSGHSNAQRSAFRDCTLP